MVSDPKSQVKVLNAENKAYFILKHIKAWKDITSDQWVIDTITGAKIEIEDFTKVPLGGSAHHKNFSGIEKTFFRKEIKRLREQGVIKHVKELDSGYIPSIFLREKKMISMD